MNKFQIIRKNLKKTQKDMADLLGISLSAYQKYELDISTPGYTVFSRLSELNINLNFLFDKSSEFFINDYKSDSIDDKISQGDYSETIKYLTQRCIELESENRELKLFSKQMGEIKNKEAS